MYQIIFRFEDQTEKRVEAAAGENLLAVANRIGIDIDAPCAGTGVCGKCRVKLLEGTVDMKQSIHLAQKDYEDGWRLACQTKVLADAVLYVPKEVFAYKNGMKIADLSSKEEVAIFDKCKQNIVSAGIPMDMKYSLVEVKMEIPSLDDTMPDNERLIRALSDATGCEKIILTYPVLSKLPVVLRDADFHVKCVALEEGDTRTILNIIKATEDMPVCEVAIDIGTTSVSAILIDVTGGAILAKTSAGNGQIRYGADVIHRIVEQEKEGGIAKLQDAVLKDTICPMMTAMCETTGVDPDMVVRAVVAANSTMNHLFLGVSAEYLRKEPYIPAFFDMSDITAKDIGMNINPAASIHVTPNIGSYVGGDITAGTFASMIWDKPEMSLFIDLGTNGELVLGNSDFLISCACSAGPAFEGGDISCGMRATDGAIEACVIDKETMEPTITVVGGGDPVGICGSGIIDLIAELFRCGIINAKGAFIRDGERVERDEHGMGKYLISSGEHKVCLTEVDIANFVRAKGAIFSAIQTMLCYLDMDTTVIEHVLVAGGIGSGINMENAVRIGMLPDIPIEKYEYIGNTSLTGAYIAAMSQTATDKITEIAQNMTYLELSIIPSYMDEFVSACFIPHTDATLFPSAQEN